MATYEVTAEIKTRVRLYVDADNPAEARYLSDELLQDGYKPELDCDPADGAEVMEYSLRIMLPRKLGRGE